MNNLASPLLTNANHTSSPQKPSWSTRKEKRKDQQQQEQQETSVLRILQQALKDRNPTNLLPPQILEDITSGWVTNYQIGLLFAHANLSDDCTTVTSDAEIELLCATMSWLFALFRPSMKFSDEVKHQQTVSM